MASLASINVKFTADLKQFRTGMQKAEKSIAKVSKSMQKYGAVMSATITAPLVLMAKNSVQLWDVQAKAIAQVEAGIKSTGAAAGFTSQQLQDMASSLQNDSLFGDEQILKEVTAQMLTFTNITGEAFEKAQQAALDLSTRLGGDLKGATLQLGKALNDPILGISALGRTGIQFSEDQKKVIKSLVETGKTAEAQALILKELENQFGGSAKAAAEAGLGPLTQIQNAWGDVLEEFGKIISEFLRPLVKHLQNAVAWFGNLSGTTKRWIVILGGIAAAIGPLLALAGTILPAIIAGFGLLSAKVLLVVGAIAAVGYVVYRNWGSISRYMKKLTNDVIDLYNEFDAIRWVIHGTIGFFKSLFEVGVLIFNGLGRVVKAFTDGVINNFRGIGRAWDAIKSGNFKQLREVISETTGNQMANLSGLVNGVLNDANKAAKKIDGHISEVKKKAQIKIDKDSFNASVAETLDGAKGVFNQFGQDAGELAGTGIKEGIKKGIQDGVKEGVESLKVTSFSEQNQDWIDNIRAIQDIAVIVPEKFLEAQPLLQESLSAWEATMIDFSQRFGDLVADLKLNLAVGIGEALGGLISGNTNFASALEGILHIFGDFLKQFGKMAIGLGIAAKEIGENLFSNPWGAIAAGIALVAIGTAIRSLKIPKMASGGVVSGRTLVEVGEYANASVNPEVIAPLDKLEGMIQGNGVNMPSVIRLTGKGDELQGVIDRTNYLNSRA